jgi:RNA polymerase sigma-70 factor, ECF subfamily
MLCEEGVMWQGDSHFIAHARKYIMPDTALHSPTSTGHLANSQAANQASSAKNPAAPSRGGPCIPVLCADLMAQRDYLVRFAQRRLHDDLALAQDAVHDVFEAVLSGHARFEGRAALRSWLTAILKNKVIDLIHQRARFDSLDASCSDDGDQPLLACETAGPEEIAGQRELLRDALARIARLPQGLRDVMQFRVLEECAGGSISAKPACLCGCTAPAGSCCVEPRNGS